MAAFGIALIETASCAAKEPANSFRKISPERDFDLRGLRAAAVRTWASVAAEVDLAALDPPA